MATFSQFLFSYLFPVCFYVCVCVCVCTYRGFPGGSVGKNLPANAGDLDLISGSGRSPWEGNGNPLHYSHLGNPMDRGAWWASVHWAAKSRTQDMTEQPSSNSIYITSNRHGHPFNTMPSRPWYITACELSHTPLELVTSYLTGVFSLPLESTPLGQGLCLFLPPLSWAVPTAGTQSRPAAKDIRLLYQQVQPTDSASPHGFRAKCPHPSPMP